MLILHGQDQKASRAQFVESKKTLAAQHELVELDGSNCTLSDLIGGVAGTSLFGQSTAVFLEHVFSRRPSAEKNSIIHWLESHPSANLVIWEAKDVSAQLKRFPAAVQQRFDLPKHVFNFLDTLSVKDFRLAAATAEAEFIVSLLAQRISEILVYLSDKQSLPSWRQTKVKALVNKFSVGRLIWLNHQLLELDYRQKSSLTPLPLAPSLELLLTKLNNQLA